MKHRAVGGDARERGIKRHGIRRGGNQRADLVAAGERAPHRIGRRAEIDGDAEGPQHGGQPLRQLIGDAVDEERRRPQRPRAGAAGAQELAVEDGRALLHTLPCHAPRKRGIQ